MSDEEKKKPRIVSVVKTHLNMSGKGSPKTRTVQMRTVEGEMISVPVTSSQPSRNLLPIAGRSLLINPAGSHMYRTSPNIKIRDPSGNVKIVRPSSSLAHYGGENFIKVPSGQMKIVKPSASVVTQSGTNNIVLIKEGITMTVKKAMQHPQKVSSSIRLPAPPPPQVFVKRPPPGLVEDIRSDWRAFKAVEQPRKYKGLREAGEVTIIEDLEEKEPEQKVIVEDVSGVEDYLFGRRKSIEKPASPQVETVTLSPSPSPEPVAENSATPPVGRFSPAPAAKAPREGFLPTPPANKVSNLPPEKLVRKFPLQPGVYKYNSERLTVVNKPPEKPMIPRPAARFSSAQEKFSRERPALEKFSNLPPEKFIRERSVEKFSRERGSPAPEKLSNLPPERVSRERFSPALEKLSIRDPDFVRERELEYRTKLVKVGVPPPPLPQPPKVSRRKQKPVTLTDHIDGAPASKPKPPPVRRVSTDSQPPAAAAASPTPPPPAPVKFLPKPKTERITITDINLTPEEKKVVESLNWTENGVASLDGNLKIVVNRFGLLEISDKSEERSESPEPFPAHKSDELFTCVNCGTYGMACDFLSTNFCSNQCVEQSDNKRIQRAERRRERHERKTKLRMQLKRFMAQQRNLEANKLDAACEVLDLEIFRIVMQLELMKFETSNIIPGKTNLNLKYLQELEVMGAPATLFKDPWPTTKNPFRLGWKLEAIDPRHPGLICVTTVVEVRGYRCRLRFDGYGAHHDFWVPANSADIFQPGWCERTAHKLTPPRNWEGTFNWTIYLEKLNAVAAPRHAFYHSQERTVMPSGFRTGMKLEAVDKKGTRNVCVASVTDVIENRILVHIDGTQDKYDYWAENNSVYIHPAGWCMSNGHKLYPPPNEPKFRWETIDTKSVFLAPARAFKPKLPHEFKVGMKLEAIDKRNPDVIRVATIVGCEPHQIRIKFDGWPAQYAYWIDDDSPDIHPIGWCRKTGHPLAAIPTPDSVTRMSECPTPGCSGVGHAFRVSPEHTTVFTCPYSPCNYLNDDLVAERFNTTEYLTVKEISHSKGTKPRTLLSKRARLMDAKKPSQKLKRKNEEPLAPEPENKKLLSELKAQAQAQVPVEAPPPSPPPPPPPVDVEALRLNKLRQEIDEKTEGLAANPRNWSDEDVTLFMGAFLGSDKANVFLDQLIDGEALLMLSKADLTENLGFKFGPAITLYNCIKVLRERALESGTRRIPF